MISANGRFAIVAVLLTSAAIFQQTHARRDPPASPVVLSSFPAQIGSWAGTNVPLTPDVLQKLGRGEFLLRAYQDQTTTQPDVDLWIAYWPNERAGQRRHTPDDCLVGSGWSIVESGSTRVSFPDAQPFEVNRYLIARGSERQLVLFWYWARGRRIAKEDRADFYLVLDSLRLNRNDDALIRLNTPIGPSEDPNHAQQRLLAFVTQADRLFDRHLPR